MKQYLVYDIETVNNKRWVDKVEATELEPRVSTELPKALTSGPPKEITRLKTDSVRLGRLVAWEIERQEKEDEFYAGLEERQALDIAEQRQTMLNKAALFWGTGKVICFGYSHNGNLNELYGDDEIKLLGAIDNRVSSLEIDEFVGKSNEFFDRFFLIGRYMANNMKVPKWLKHRHSDVDQYFGFGSSRSGGQKATLEKYLWAIGEPGKLGKGSDVGDWYALDKWDTITEYCRGDVAGTEKIYLRYNH